MLCRVMFFSLNAKCYNILMIILPAKYRLGEADTVRSEYVHGQSYISTIQSYGKVITPRVELLVSPNAKCNKILIATFLAHFRLREADEVRKDVFSRHV